MGIDVSKCIGCGRCAMRARRKTTCRGSHFSFRTWVERYQILGDGEVDIQSPNGAVDGLMKTENREGVLRSFFVPKICNHCRQAPLRAGLPRGATFRSPDGVVLVDSEYCIGCRYCIRPARTAARFLHRSRARRKNARSAITGSRTACCRRCVEVCPTQARIFGELKKKASPLVRFLRLNSINVLKPSLNTDPKVYYAHLDTNVR